MTNPLNLTELQIALLYSAAGDSDLLNAKLGSKGWEAVKMLDASSELAEVLDATSELANLNLITPDSTAVGAGYITTDAGNAYLAGLAKP